MKPMEIIDAFCHWLPRSYYEGVAARSSADLHMFKRAYHIPEMSKLGARDQFVDEVPGYRQILSIVSPPIEALGQPEETPAYARMANEGLAERVADDPNRYPAFVASLPLNNEGATQTELAYATESLKAAGFQIFTHVNGNPLDQAPVIESVFAWAAEHRQPIWLHPSRGFQHPDYQNREDSYYEIWWSLGWLYETSAALLHLAYSGVFDRWPDLKLITHHAGAMIPFAEGRLRTGVRKPGMRLPEDRQELAQVRSDRPVIDSLKQCYADTATFGTADAILAASHFFGAEKLLFATDMPFGPGGGRDHRQAAIEGVRFLPIKDTQKAAILSTNLRTLLPSLP